MRLRAQCLWATVPPARYRSPPLIGASRSSNVAEPVHPAFSASVRAQSFVLRPRIGSHFSVLPFHICSMALRPAASS